MPPGPSSSGTCSDLCIQGDPTHSVLHAELAAGKGFRQGAAVQTGTSICLRFRIHIWPRDTIVDDYIDSLLIFYLSFRMRDWSCGTARLANAIAKEALTQCGPAGLTAWSACQVTEGAFSRVWLEPFSSFPSAPGFAELARSRSRLVELNHCEVRG